MLVVRCGKGEVGGIGLACGRTECMENGATKVLSILRGLRRYRSCFSRWAFERGPAWSWRVVFRIVYSVRSCFRLQDFSVVLVG